MEKLPQYSHPTGEKELVVDTKKLAAEDNATLPQAVSRDEKGTYAESFSGYAPEVVKIDDTGKEVDYRPEIHETRGTEAIATDSPLYHVHGGFGNASRQGGRHDPASDPEVTSPPKKTERRFCGLAKWPFIFVLVACILAIAVALGAGLATTLSKKSNQTPSSPVNSSTSAPSSTSATPSATSSTPAATPTLRDYRDHVKYNLTVWSGKNFTGAWQVIDRVGYYQLGFNVSSYYWHCGQFTTSEMCSMSFCADADLVAWRGGEDRVLADIGSVVPKLPNRAKIMCGGTFGNPGCVVESYTMTPTVYPSPPTPDSTSFTRL